METLHQYLKRLGLLTNPNPVRLQQAKAEYQRLYKREKNQQYRRVNTRCEITLKPDEAKLMQKGADNHALKLASFVKQTALAYVRQVFIVPDQQQVTRIEIALRRIGNNINQAVHRLHAGNSSQYLEVVKLQQQLNALEKEVSRCFREPMTLENLIRVELPKQPHLYPLVHKLLKRNGYV